MKAKKKKERERGRKDSFWRAEGSGRTGSKKEEGKSGLGDGQVLTLGKMKKRGLQKCKASGGQ